MHSDYNDWVDDIPASVIRAQARAELETNFSPPTDPPERRMEWCDECVCLRPHSELPDGYWCCSHCGGQ